MDKILTSEINATNVKSVAGSRLTGTVESNKNVFDRLGELIASKFNALIDDLSSQNGANEIGVSYNDISTTLQNALIDIFTNISDRYTKNETSSLVNAETRSLVADVGVNLTNGVITITKKDGSVVTYDTAIEKVPAKFEIIDEGGTYYFKITNVDGSITKTDVTNLMNIYDFSTDGDLIFSKTVNGNKVTFTGVVKNNSITLDKLSLETVSQLEKYRDDAKSSVLQANTLANNAKASEQNTLAYKTAVEETKSNIDKTAQEVYENASVAQLAMHNYPQIGENNHWFCFDTSSGTIKDTEVKAQGENSVYIGETPPSWAEVWIDPSGNADDIVAELKEDILNIKNELSNIGLSTVGGKICITYDKEA